MTPVVCGLAMTMAALSPLQAPSLDLNVTVAVAGDTGRLGFGEEQLLDALTVMVASKFRDARIVTDDTELLNVALNLSCVSNACSWRIRLTTKLLEGPFGTLSLGDWWGTGGVLRTGDVFDRLTEELDRALDRPAAAWLRLTDEERGCWREYFADPRSRLPQCGDPPPVR